jgi:hypothetical protein
MTRADRNDEQEQARAQNRVARLYNSHLDANISCTIIHNILYMDSICFMYAFAEVTNRVEWTI